MSARTSPCCVLLSALLLPVAVAFTGPTVAAPERPHFALEASDRSAAIARDAVSVEEGLVPSGDPKGPRSSPDLAVPWSDTEAPLSAPFVDVPAEEISIGGMLDPTTSYDSAPEVFARPDGQVVLIAQEDWRVVALHSDDGGLTFGAAVTVAGGPGQLLVSYHQAALAPDGTLHVALAILDPLGDVGLQVTHSADMGQTWSMPVDIVRSGSPLMGVWYGRNSMAIATGVGGRVALFFARESFAHYYVTASSDGGATWTTPIRVDPNAPENLTSSAYGVDVAIGSEGVIHCAYTQRREQYSFTLQYTRSTNGGLSFEPERQLSTSGRYPDLEIAADGSIMIGVTRGRYVDVWRSTDGGANFTSQSLLEIGSSTSPRYPQIRSVAGSPTVLLVAAYYDLSVSTAFGPLVVWRSADNGASFAQTATLASRSLRSQSFSLQHTPSGAWAVAWSDVRSDYYAFVMADVYVSSSLDDGLTFGFPSRADADLAGSSASRIASWGLGVSGEDDLVVGWSDGRDSVEKSRNLYVNTSPAHGLVFGYDRRVHQGTGAVNVLCNDGELATDKVSHVYAAFGAVARGPYQDIYVSSSTDRGYTFGRPVRVGAGVPGQRIEKIPQVLARDDGRVYLTFQAEDPGTLRRQLWFNRSFDFGTTWRSTHTFVGWAASPCGYPGYVCGYQDLEVPQVGLGPTGTVYVAWSDLTDVWFARTDDDGLTFSSSIVDQGVGDEYHSPAMCTRGPQVVLSFVTYDFDTGASTVWGTTSQDGGRTWTTATNLQTGAGGASADFYYLQCAGSPAGPEVLVTWSDSRSGMLSPYANRWNGASWEFDRAIPAPPNGTDNPRLVYSTANNVVVTFDCYGDQGVWASWSSDGGASFANAVSLDSVAPEPMASSFNARPAADGQGNVWVIWDEASAGIGNSLAIRRSSDHGHSWDPVYRLNRDLPQGGRYTSGFWNETPIDTFPGMVLVGFLGQRSSQQSDMLAGAYDTFDFDRDGAPAGVDCSDTDPGAKAVPVEVAAVAVQRTAVGARVSWTSQSNSAGKGTSYDIATGRIGELIADAGYQRATCLASDLTTNGYDDNRSASKNGDWYLLRAQNACGAETYGDSGQFPDPRDRLDILPPCP